MERTVRVVGTGRMNVRPDLIAVSLSISSKNKDEAKAMAESAGLMEALRDSLAPLGFEPSALKTVSFNVNAEYDSVREGGVYKNVFSGYSVRHGLKLEFGFDTELLSRVLSAVTGCIAEPEVNVGFTVRDRDGISSELLTIAVRDARERAKVLAEASGVSLGRLLSIEYGGNEPDFVSPTRFAANARLSLKAAPVDMAVEPEDIRLTENAVLVWEIL